MNVNFYESHHFFENRLYISSMQPEEIAAKVQKDNGRELKGFGIRSYSPIIGKALSALGFASKLTVNNETFYVNNKSFSKYIIRASELGIDNSNAPEKMDASYEAHKRDGYKRNVIESVNQMFQQILRQFNENNETFSLMDISSMINSLAQIATENKKK